MIVLNLYYLTLLTLGIGTLTAVVLRPNEHCTNYIAHGMAALGSISAVLCAIFIFREGMVISPLFSWGRLGLVTVRLDYLAAFFLLITGLLGTVTGIYAMGYCREFYQRRLWLMAACFNAFLLSLILVFSVNHVAAFLVAWEGMTIVSFFLVNHEWERPENRRAAYIYLTMTHIATAFIIVAFMLLAIDAGSFDFTELAKAKMDEATRNIIFFCVLLGFGTKAGIIPVHIWLPKAHPAAPSHVSALMSGVMIKAAIYGLCRFFLEFVPGGPLWWGEAVMALAILSCVLGVLYALMEHDLKRLLAYHSVENIGIILLGVGAGLVYVAKGQPMLAGLAWSAALFHTLNHAIFKSLLFLGAGAVVQATHTKDIEKLGGLIHNMPRTAVLFLGGSAAISALPPLNGFVSEWLTFQALFYLPHAIGAIGGKLVGAILVALLGLTGALAAACFVKAFGIAFLAKPRSMAAAQAKEAPSVMLAPMSVLALLCVILGVWPQPVLHILKATLAGYAGISVSGLLDYQWFGVAIQSGAGQGLMGVPIAIACLLIGILAAIVIVNWNGKPSVISGETWTCGICPTARMEYTATGFSKPVRIAFRSILQPQRHKVVDTTDNSYYGRQLEYHLSIHYVLNDKFYRPLHLGVIRIAKYIRKIQNGSLQLYIGYILAITVAALIWSAR